MFCPNCGEKNSHSARFCASCGKTLLGKDAEVSTIAAVESRWIEQYEAFVGWKNRDYYVGRFARYDRDGGAGVSWHWPAFFITFYWLLYRKMWLAAFAYLIVPYVLYFPYMFMVETISRGSEVARVLWYSLYLIAYFVLPPLFANAAYYRHAKSKIEQVEAASPNKDRQLGELSAKGGTSNAAAVVLSLVVLISILGLLAAIAIPAYQNYTTKVKISNAVVYGRSATESVANYYYRNGRVPEDLETSGFSMPMPKEVKDIALNANDGTITIDPGAEITGVDGGALIFMPSLDESQQIVWTCVGRGIDDSFLPPNCRARK